MEIRRYIKNRVRNPKNKRPSIKRDASNTENSVIDENKDKTDKPRFPRKRSHKRVKAGEENDSLNTEVQVSSYISNLHYKTVVNDFLWNNQILAKI